MTTSAPSTHGQPHPTSATPSPDVRQFVSFAFYRLDPAWRRQSASTKSSQAWEFVSSVERFSHDVMVLSYSLLGLRADVDFMLWRVSDRIEPIQAMSAALLQTTLGGYLTTSYAYLSMTKRSTYQDKLDPAHPENRRVIRPFHSKYLFIYPFIKTTDWYMLPFQQRQAMMDEHIILGNKYPSVRIHTTYSFGLDDQEFVLAFETDEPKDFLDLVMEMRESKARPYTLRDTPIFTCVAKPLKEIMKELGA